MTASAPTTPAELWASLNDFQRLVLRRLFIDGNTVWTFVEEVMYDPAVGSSSAKVTGALRALANRGLVEHSGWGQWRATDLGVRAYAESDVARDQRG